MKLIQENYHKESSGATKNLYSILKIRFPLIFIKPIYSEEISKFATKEDELKDKLWHKQNDCSKSYTRIHQRRHWRTKEGSSVLYRSKAYCWFCKKFIKEGADTKISGF